MEIKYLLAFGISLVATLVVMPLLIPFLHKIKFGQSIRKEGPQSHMAKTGTPTMGGLVFVSVPILVMLVLDYKAFFSGEMLICVLAYLGYALIGFIDDFLIVVKKNNDGLKPSVKFLMQSVLAVVFYLFYRSIAETTLILPVVHISLELGILYFVLIFFMFTCESNAVNLTDGLNGMCAGTSIIAIAPFVIFALLQEIRIWQCCFWRYAVRCLGICALMCIRLKSLWGYRLPGNRRSACGKRHDFKAGAAAGGDRRCLRHGAAVCRHSGNKL